MGTSGGTDERGARRASRGQSSVLGSILVIGLVLVGTAMVVTLGSAALTDVQTQTELERAEHSMTLFNSRAAMAALGDSPTQEVNFGADKGSFETRQDDSWLRITHANHTGNGDDEVIYNESLGTVVYENDGTEIAYQGGGVWRKDPGGEGMMISPPEFHYRAATLTLPIVRVNEPSNPGHGSKVQISRANDTKRVFPNSSATYDVGSSVYQNPVANGTINITIKTEYYHGWAEYFRTNTEGQVTTFPDDNRVRVTLISLAGSIGDFDMPNEGNSLGIQGMGNDHPVNSFDISLRPDNHYGNMHWSFYADGGNEQLEIHFYSDGKCTGSGYNGDIDTSIYYYNSSGSTTIHEEWQNMSVDVEHNDDFTLDCSTGELTIDLLGSTTMQYGDIDMTGSDNKWMYGAELKGADPPSQTTSFGPHDPDHGQYSVDDKEELGFLVNHYLQMTGPTYDFTVVDGPGGSSRVDESQSTGTLTFETGTGAKYITYLHVTQNDIDVRFR